MRITSVEATPVNIPFRAPYRYALGSTASLTKTLIEVNTDEGVVGLGEYAAGDGRAIIDRLSDRVIGLDPLDLNECERRCVPNISYNLWEDLTGLRRGFGAIEMALWDIRARAADVPLAALLGGVVRRQIPFTEYFAFRLEANGEGGETTPKDIAAYCARMIEEYDPPWFEGKMATIDVNTEIKMVRDVRSVIGEDRSLRLDANAGWSIATTRHALARLEEYDIRCFEDPVDTFEDMARLRHHTGMAFSTHNPDLRRAVALGTPEYFVVNLVELGGIRRTIEFIRACEHFGIGFWFHSGEAGVASAAYLQVAAAVEEIREPSQALFHWYTDDVIEQGLFCPRRGLIDLPEGPGLGVTLDAAGVKRCHERFLAEGSFPSGARHRPESRFGSFGSLSRT